MTELHAGDAAVTSLERPSSPLIDIYAIVTKDGGATWYGFPGGQDFS